MPLYQSKRAFVLRAFVAYVTLLCDVTSVQSLDCGSEYELPVAWANLPPYIFYGNVTGEAYGSYSGEEPEGALHGVMVQMVLECCGPDYS